jgi:hypothetical protein
LILEKTSASAIRCSSFKRRPGDVRSTLWRKTSRPTPSAHRKILCRAGGSFATFSFTRAYIFS